MVSAPLLLWPLNRTIGKTTDIPMPQALPEYQRWTPDVASVDMQRPVGSVLGSVLGDYCSDDMCCALGRRALGRLVT